MKTNSFNIVKRSDRSVDDGQLGFSNTDRSTLFSEFQRLKTAQMQQVSNGESKTDMSKSWKGQCLNNHIVQPTNLESIGTQNDGSIDGCLLRKNVSECYKQSGNERVINPAYRNDLSGDRHIGQSSSKSHVYFERQTTNDGGNGCWQLDGLKNSNSLQHHIAQTSHFSNLRNDTSSSSLNLMAPTGGEQRHVVPRSGGYEADYKELIHLLKRVSYEYFSKIQQASDQNITAKPLQSSFSSETTNTPTQKNANMGGFGFRQQDKKQVASRKKKKNGRVKKFPDCARLSPHKVSYSHVDKSSGNRYSKSVTSKTGINQNIRNAVNSSSIHLPISDDCEYYNSASHSTKTENYPLKVNSSLPTGCSADSLSNLESINLSVGGQTVGWQDDVVSNNNTLIFERIQNFLRQAVATDSSSTLDNNLPKLFQQSQNWAQQPSAEYLPEMRSPANTTKFCTKSCSSGSPTPLSKKPSKIYHESDRPLVERMTAERALDVLLRDDTFLKESLEFLGRLEQKSDDFADTVGSSADCSGSCFEEVDNPGISQRNNAIVKTDGNNHQTNDSQRGYQIGGMIEDVVIQKRGGKGENKRGKLSSVENRESNFVQMNGKYSMNELIGRNKKNDFDSFSEDGHVVGKIEWGDDSKKGHSIDERTHRAFQEPFPRDKVIPINSNALFGTSSVTKDSRDSQSCEWQNQFFKTKFCPYHLEGRCVNGKRCRFAHYSKEVRMLPDLRHTKLCDSYGSGKVCENGDCSFAHSPAELRTSNNSFYKISLCNFYKKGKCWNGENCRFAHGLSQLRQTSGSDKQEKEIYLNSQKRNNVKSNSGVKKVLSQRKGDATKNNVGFFSKNSAKKNSVINADFQLPLGDNICREIHPITTEMWQPISHPEISDGCGESDIKSNIRHLDIRLPLNLWDEPLHHSSVMYNQVGNGTPNSPITAALLSKAQLGSFPFRDDSPPRRYKSREFCASQEESRDPENRFFRPPFLSMAHSDPASVNLNILAQSICLLKGQSESLPSSTSELSTQATTAIHSPRIMEN